MKNDLTDYTYTEAQNTPENQGIADKILKGMFGGVLSQFNIFDILEDLPVIKYFVPLMKLMAFQYPDVPYYVGLFLNLIGILTVFVTIEIIKP